MAISEKVEEHCHQCEDCAGFLQQSKLLQLNLERSVSAEPDAQRSQRIINEIHRQSRVDPVRRQQEHGLWQKWGVRGASCAMVCLLPILILFVNQPQIDPAQVEMGNLQEDILSITNFFQSASEPLKVLTKQ